MVSTIIGTALGLVLGTVIMGAAMVIWMKPIMRWYMKKVEGLIEEEGS